MSHAAPIPLRVNVKPGYWRLTLAARIQRLDLQATLGTFEVAARTRALQHLREAERLTTDSQNPIELWSGSQVEKAWTELRLAEEALLQGATQTPDITANAHLALSHAKGRLADGDARVAALTAALTVGGDSPTPDQRDQIRAHSLTVTIAAHEVADEEHRAQREFRNRLRAITAALVLLAITLAAVALFAHIPDGWIPVPAGATAGHAIVAALLLGAGGALFSAVPSVTQAPTNTTTFNPVVEQATLKVVVGSWSALVGLVAVAAGIQTAGADAASPAGFAMMCALFGAMQEAITRFADQKATQTTPTTT